MRESDFIVTNDSKVFTESKGKGVLYVEKDRPHPGGSVFKLQAENYCSKFQKVKAESSTLSQGVYVAAQ